MQTHRITHRFVTGREDRGTRISTRFKDFDVALARKMLREGSTLALIGEAMGMTGAAVHKRLCKLGLRYLTADRERIKAVMSVSLKKSHRVKGA